MSGYLNMLYLTFELDIDTIIDSVDVWRCVCCGHLLIWLQEKAFDLELRFEINLLLTLRLIWKKKRLHIIQSKK